MLRKHGQFSESMPAYRWGIGCCCDATQYVTLRKLNDSTGAVVLNLDHGATLYCIAADSTYVYVGGERAADGYTTRVYTLAGTLTASLDHGATVTSIEVDSSGNLYTHGYSNNGIARSTVQEGSGAQNEIQRLEYDNSAATSGTFRLNYFNYTSALDYDATAAEVESALEALVQIGSGNVSCTGGPLNTDPIDIEFVGSLALTNVFNIGIDQTNLGGVTTRKYNSSFVEQWNYKLNHPVPSDLVIGSHAIAVDSSGNVYLAGNAVGYSSEYGGITGLNSSGTFQWVHGAHSARGTSVVSDGTYVYGATIGQISQIKEAFELELTGAVTGGTFTLTVDGQTTGSIAYNASAATVKTALEALSNVTTATTNGSLPGIMSVVLEGSSARTDYSSITGTSSLSGGSPAISITKFVDGDGQSVGSRSGTLAKLNSSGAYQLSGLGGYHMQLDASASEILGSGPTNNVFKVDYSGSTVWLESYGLGTTINAIGVGSSSDYYTATSGAFTPICKKFNSSRVQQWGTTHNSGTIRGIAWDGTNSWFCGDRVTL